MHSDAYLVVVVDRPIPAIDGLDLGDYVHASGQPLVDERPRETCDPGSILRRDHDLGAQVGQHGLTAVRSGIVGH